MPTPSTIRLVHLAPRPGTSGVGDYAEDFARAVRPYVGSVESVHYEAPRTDRVVDMVARMDEEHFGHCTNHGACQEACPKGISVDYIARLQRDYRRAQVRRPGDLVG